MLTEQTVGTKTLVVCIGIITRSTIKLHMCIDKLDEILAQLLLAYAYGQYAMLLADGWITVAALQTCLRVPKNMWTFNTKV